MAHYNLNYLLGKLIRSDINAEEYDTLRDGLEQSPPEEVNASLERLWDNASFPPVQMDMETKIQMISNICSQSPSVSPGRRFLAWAKVAAILIPTVLAVSFYLFRSEEEPVVEQFTVLAGKGYKSQVLLPDGTHVWLNSGSHLSYASDFNQGSRKVKLEGEGYFEVAHNEQVKFVVEISDLAIEVLGTKFNVSDYPTESVIDISLLEGKVSINAARDGSRLSTIAPNQHLVWEKQSRRWSLTECDAKLSNLWINNVLKFEDTPITEVYQKLERWYGVNIHLKNQEDKVRYGFTVKDESLPEILALINRLTPISYLIEGEEVNISYK